MQAATSVVFSQYGASIVGRLEFMKKVETIAREVSITGLVSSGNFDGTYIIYDVT